jgi:hypothetical protein
VKKRAILKDLEVIYVDICVMMMATGGRKVRVRHKYRFITTELFVDPIRKAERANCP